MLLPVHISALGLGALAVGAISTATLLASALSPLLSGWLPGLSAFGWPLVAAGALKIASALLLRAYAGVRPPEEAHLDGPRPRGRARFGRAEAARGPDLPAARANGASAP